MFWTGVKEFLMCDSPEVTLCSCRDVKIKNQWTNSHFLLQANPELFTVQFCLFQLWQICLLHPIIHGSVQSLSVAPPADVSQLWPVPGQWGMLSCQRQCSHAKDYAVLPKTVLSWQRQCCHSKDNTVFPKTVLSYQRWCCFAKDDAVLPKTMSSCQR